MKLNFLLFGKKISKTEKIDCVFDLYSGILFYGIFSPQNGMYPRKNEPQISSSLTIACFSLRCRISSPCFGGAPARSSLPVIQLRFVNEPMKITHMLNGLAQYYLNQL